MERPGPPQGDEVVADGEAIRSGKRPCIDSPPGCNGGGAGGELEEEDGLRVRRRRTREMAVEQQVEAGGLKRQRDGAAEGGAESGAATRISMIANRDTFCPMHAFSGGATEGGKRELNVDTLLVYTDTALARLEARLGKWHWRAARGDG